jgi:ATP-dependent RNA helicase DOB1
MRPYSLSYSFPVVSMPHIKQYCELTFALHLCLDRMEAVFAWCKGVKFVDVQKLTGSFEGTTIRTLRRLEELVRQITSAAKAIGDHDLEVKFEEGSKLLKRDIVFCNSLYL